MRQNRPPHNSCFAICASGFTVMEMMVTIGIMTFITLLYLANYRGFQQGLVVEAEADRIASSLRQLQIWALSGELIGSTRPEGGYGFTTNAPCTSGTCTYTVFGDICNPDNHVYNSGCDTVVRTDQLNALVSITATSPSSPLNITFGFPTATTSINGILQNGTLTLTHRNDPSKMKIISLDGVSGQITIQ